jgi:hypothetical protein
MNENRLFLLVITTKSEEHASMSEKNIHEKLKFT